MPRRNSDSSEEGDAERLTLGQRLRKAVLKPEIDDGAEKPEPVEPTVEELEDREKRADDRERAIGLVAAPLAAAISFLIIASRIDNDPAAYLKSGKPNSLHVSVSLYHELQLVLLALAVLILGFAWFRKRLFLGIVLALYGLAVFNLGFWGFGVPFVIAGAWYLVRAYRIQQKLKTAAGEQPGRSPSGGRAPRPSKRYTPPSASRRRPRPEDEPNAS
jgi:hypothetical protein